MPDQGIDIRKIKSSIAAKSVESVPVGRAVTKPSRFSIQELLHKDITLFGSGLNDKAREAFYMELSILLEAGVDIRSSLDLIASEQSKTGLKDLFTSIKESIIKGGTLAKALQETGKFSNYEFFSIQIGEESGKIVPVLKDLAAYFQKKAAQRRQLVGALTYPAVVMVTALGAVFFMITFVVPMFSDIFKRFGGDLPTVTKLVIAVSVIIKTTFPVILLGIIACAVLLYTQRKQTWFRRYASLFVSRIPLFGDMVSKIYLSRFCYSMTLLIGARIPILRAMNLVKQMIAFYPIETSLTQIEEEILQGTPLHKAMEAHAIYPKRMIALLKVGEEVNQLELFFETVAKQYAGDVEHQTSVISSVIEPIIIIFLGLIVGTILVSMYLPLFKLGSSF